MNLSDLMLERGVSTHELANLINVTNDEFCSKLRGTLSWDITEVVTICNRFKTVNIGLFGVHLDSNT